MPPTGSANRPAWSHLAAAFIVLAIGCSAALTGCSGQDSQALADQACSHIERGLTAAHKTATSPAQARQLQTEALDQIRAMVEEGQGELAVNPDACAEILVRVRALTAHPKFSAANPNRVRALVGEARLTLDLLEQGSSRTESGAQVPGLVAVAAKR